LRYTVAVCVYQAICNDRQEKSRSGSNLKAQDPTAGARWGGRDPGKAWLTETTPGGGVCLLELSSFGRRRVHFSRAADPDGPGRERINAVRQLLPARRP